MGRKGLLSNGHSWPGEPLPKVATHAGLHLAGAVQIQERRGGVGLNPYCPPQGEEVHQATKHRRKSNSPGNPRGPSKSGSWDLWVKERVETSGRQKCEQVQWSVLEKRARQDLTDTRMVFVCVWGVFLQVLWVSQMVKEKEGLQYHLKLLEVPS